MTLKDLKRGAIVRGVIPNEDVEVIDVKWHGDSVVELTYKDKSGKPGNTLLYRDNEPTLEIITEGTPWSFDSDGNLFKLASEAYRISMAYLFDPMLAVHSSQIMPLPHQITAVYEEMLTRQPLRFLLADDPGAGKTIMAGLLIKELIVRGDLHRCLIVSPGNLAEQWQDELYSKFHLHFQVATKDKLESAASGNWFAETPLAICRLDMLSRNDDLKDKLKQTEWDLVVCDEAHKMSASYFAGEINYTKRYRLGRVLGEITRHFLLMTATPHNGKDDDFQLFMALLDGDRFEGKYRDGVHVVDPSDLMRRLVKEELVKFDGKPLFPERRAYSVNYRLSSLEAQLYATVTNYVREEFNRAEALQNDGRKGTVGFALTILQRRLASSPEALYQSIRRRKERLEKRLKEEQLVKRGVEEGLTFIRDLPSLSEDDIDDLDDAPDAEVEEEQEQILDQATAARTIAELEKEINTLRKIEEFAYKVKHSGTDKKWDELSGLLHDNKEMFDAQGHRRKLVIFTEHRDTLSYLVRQIQKILGRNEAVVSIYGGMGREERKKIQELFTQDKTVEILVATDAAGEGINLQRAHLMVNYDLPWNPNRLEQRFGRIHRIGQTEVCHLWNLVADETREGEVYCKLLQKIEAEHKALKGSIFDILGKAIQGKELRKLLIEAIRYGDDPKVKAKLHTAVENAFDKERLQTLMEERALARSAIDDTQIRRIREEMERAEARRLQPHFIASFFLAAFELLGGSVRAREQNRYELTHVPGGVRNRDRLIGTGETVLQRYERITFEKELVTVPGKPPASFVSPGHPLLASVIDLILERYREYLKRGAVLVSPNDTSLSMRILFYIEHSIQDARTREGNRRVVSREIQFVEMDESGKTSMAGYAPHLDYRALSIEEKKLMEPVISNAEWLKQGVEEKATSYAIQELVPKHYTSVKTRKEELIDKTMAEVKNRLTKEIGYWDHRANELKNQELSGKVNAKMNSGKARMRADDLQARLEKRMRELEQERKLSPQPPVVIGGALIVPEGLLQKRSGQNELQSGDTKRIEALAMNTVIEAEIGLGHNPRDVSDAKCGYDIESVDGKSGRLRFIEVKGRDSRANTVSITKNEILTALNKPEAFILAVVQVDGDAGEPKYIRQPFSKEPDFGVTSVNYNINELLAKAEEPN